MNKSEPPLVTLLTPVYNGAKYLQHAIQSVIDQSYPHWEYFVVNNGSTDDTLDIAQDYANRDSRIRIVSNDEFVDAIENHNIAFRQVGEDSTYCKVLHADDFLFPRFLEETVRIAGRYPAAGLIGAYVLWGKKVAGDGIALEDELMAGREVCRQTLLQKIYPFANLSGLLFRADLVRERDPFLKGKHLHIDVETYFELLRQCDFGFAHQVLSFVRRHEESRSATQSERLKTYILARLDLLLKFGPIYLTEAEYKNARERQSSRYYRFLANAVSKEGKGEVWQYHIKTLADMGYPVSGTKLELTRMLLLLERAVNRLKALVKYT